MAISKLSNKIKVLITDDSALVRKMLSTYLKRYNNIEVVGTATDPYDARDKIVQFKPDVLTLDIEMPKMDGISFLEKIMKHHPIPTVMVSSRTQEGSNATLKALSIGAVDFVGKPSANTIGTADVFVEELYQKILIAAKANVSNLCRPTAINNTTSTVRRTLTPSGRATNKIIAIGASTGGTEAVKSVLTKIPRESPGIVITQHMPEVFTKYFAERLDSLSEIDVREAENGMCVEPGTALLAPGNFHIEVIKNGSKYSVSINQKERVNRHRPSVDVLFDSVAKCAGSNAVGVIMTGMGDDGAKGLLNMKNGGADTIAQDEESCVVFGMPKEAIKLGAANKIVSLSEIPYTIFTYMNE